LPVDIPQGPERRSLAERVAGRIVPHGISFEPKRPVPPVDIPPLRPVAETLVADPEPATTKAPDRPADAYLQIDFKRLDEAGFITPDTPYNVNTQEFRAIKRQILKASFPDDSNPAGSQSRVILVTSSAPAEGKTFTSLNLAMSISTDKDIQVLLVDADGYRRSLTALMDAGDKLGVIDLLSRPALQLRDNVLSTNIANLSFLPAGLPHPRAGELLNSRKLSALMHDIALKFPDHLILIDTPPVLASSEAAILAAQVGQILVVAEKDRTSKRALRQSLAMLEDCRTVSCILNMATANLGGSAASMYGY